MNLTGEEKRTILAAYLGWTLDAFDFFVLTFVIKDIAKEFGVEVSSVAYALFLTLAMRFIWGPSSSVALATNGDESRR